MPGVKKIEWTLIAEGSFKKDTTELAIDVSFPSPSAAAFVYGASGKRLDGMIGR